MSCKLPIFRIVGPLLGAAALLATAVPSAATAAAPSDCPGARLIPTAANLARVQDATFCLINEQRADHGLKPLRENADLQAAAEGHSASMVTRDYFDHDSPTGASPMARVLAAGYASLAGIREVGEIIAAASGSLASPAAAVASWMHSPPHRAEILNPAFRDTGIGVVAAIPASLGIGRSGATYAEDFGARR
jgi:uncharacterized protein YkwD